MSRDTIRFEEPSGSANRRPTHVRVPARVPVDLCDWVGKNGLACLALEAATEAGAKVFNGRYRNDPIALTRAKRLLALLAYCYAAGLYGSDDIEWRIQDDPMVRYLAGSTPPDWGRLRAFRRQWRALIHDALARLFTLAWARQLEYLDEVEAACGTLEPGSEDYQHLSRFFHNEVEDRISRAVLLDSMFADD